MLSGLARACATVRRNGVWLPEVRFNPGRTRVVSFAFLLLGGFCFSFRFSHTLSCRGWWVSDGSSWCPGWVLSGLQQGQMAYGMHGLSAQSLASQRGTSLSTTSNMNTQAQTWSETYITTCPHKCMHTHVCTHIHKMQTPFTPQQTYRHAHKQTLSSYEPKNVGIKPDCHIHACRIQFTPPTSTHMRAQVYPHPRPNNYTQCACTPTHKCSQGGCWHCGKMATTNGQQQGHCRFECGWGQGRHAPYPPHMKGVAGGRSLPPPSSLTGIYKSHHH
jgi:hypothetical protein